MNIDFPLQTSPNGGYLLGETATHYIELMPMIYNHRIVMTPKDFPDGYDAGWCYPDVLTAVLAASLWDPETEPRPRGWTKDVLTQERNG